MKLGIASVCLTFILTYFSWLFLYSVPYIYIYIYLLHAFHHAHFDIDNFKTQKTYLSFIKKINCEIAHLHDEVFYLLILKN